MSAAGGSIGEAAAIGAALAFGGLAFLRFGWQGLRRRAPEPEPGLELAAPPAAASAAMKAVWAFCLAFGLFVLGCGLLLFLSIFLPE